MADETTQTEATEEQPDYKRLYEQMKAQARKWEDRAKENKEKADRLDDVEGRYTSLLAAHESVKAENESMKAEQARHQLVAAVAAATGLSESIVGSLSGSDEASLTEQANSIMSLMPKGAPTAPEAGEFPRDGAPAKTAAQQFGDMVSHLLG